MKLVYLAIKNSYQLLQDQEVSMENLRLKTKKFCESFRIETFKNISHEKLNNLTRTSYNELEETFLNLINKHDPPPTKNIKTEHQPIICNKRTWQGNNEKMKSRKQNLLTTEITKPGVFFKKQRNLYLYY